MSSQPKMASSHQAQPLDSLSRQVVSKVFIQRDYSDGTGVKFQTRFPQELEGKIDQSNFQYTINEINEIFSEAEAVGSRAYCEGCLACLTAYTIFICMDTHYQKCLKRIALFAQDQNENIYLPRGLMITDPMERGLRVIEICVLRQDK
ncbi:golgin subfamily A member 7-like [Ptychodera flava]|uniref:golgin subfamily A member 7-like n=1 Tax=Ptychodera flava TaxID=63121 RepID=UPI00396A8EAE